MNASAAITRRRLLLGVAATAASMSLLSACGPTAPASPPAAPTTPPAPKPADAKPAAQPTTAPPAAPAATAKPATQPTAAPAAKPAARQLVIAQGTDAPSLDPYLGAGQNEWNIQFSMFDTLVSRDANGKPVPQLAESWERTSPTSWVFKLRKGVKFHNGEPFNAEAVKFTFDRAADPNLKGVRPTRANLSLESTRVIDDSTVEFKTVAFWPQFTSQLLGFMMVEPKHYSQGTDITGRRPIGTGPYRFVEWVKDDRVVAEANPEYWGGAPTLSRVVWRAIPDTATRIAALQAGDAHIVTEVPADRARTIQQSADLETRIAKGSRRFWMSIRTDKKPLDDARVRAALNLAVNKDALIRQLLGGFAQPLDTVVQPGDANPSTKLPGYDQAKARQLLQEAGVNNLSLTLDAPIGRYVRGEEVAQAVAADLTKIGVPTEVKTYEWATYADNWVKKNTNELFLVGGSFRFEAEAELRWFHKNNQLEVTHWDANTTEGKEFHDIIEQLSTTTEDPRRRELSFKAQEVLYSAPPAILLYLTDTVYGVTKKTNWQPRQDEFIFLQGVSLS